jgi:hypothetical protein
MLAPASVAESLTAVPTGTVIWVPDPPPPEREVVTVEPLIKLPAASRTIEGHQVVAEIQISHVQGEHLVSPGGALVEETPVGLLTQC